MRVYIASPYTKGCQAENVLSAQDTGDKLMAMGNTPFLPLLNHYWNACSPKTEKTWLDWDLKWLEVCDCVLRLEGESKGADIEVAVAERLGKKVYYSLEEIGKLCPKCGESDKLSWDIEDNVKSCLCGWRGYGVLPR